MSYVDGFVVPVPKRALAAYKKMSVIMGKICREAGATDYKECYAEGLGLGKVTSFPRSVKLKKGEVVVFSWIVYPSKKVRDQTHAKIMKDPRVAKMMTAKMPFDGKRMITGGFKVFVDV